jgi:hypothetical protein
LIFPSISAFIDHTFLSNWRWFLQLFCISSLFR